jgi:hypothetical protein
MMKHRNIEATAIRSLVHEDATAATVADEINAIYDTLDEVIKPAHINGRKLKGDVLRSVFDECCRRLVTMADPIDSDQSFRAATKTRPKGEAYQARFVGFKRVEDSPAKHEQYQLFNFRIFASRKLVRIDYQQQPFAFQYHTAERLLERGQEKRGALRRLAVSVYKASAMLMAAQKYSTDKLSGRMIAPMSDGAGLLLGDYINKSVSSGKRRTYDHSSCRDNGINIAGSDITFLARTFVSNGMLRPDQLKLAKAISEWQTDYNSENLRAVRDFFWRSDMQVDTRDWAPLEEKAYDALATILDNEDAAATIKGKSGAMF